jgi:DNA-binding MarR family transcriptional regulator
MATSTVSKRADTDDLAPEALEAWKNFVVANSRLMRELDEELRREHGFTLGDYDVLIHLSRAPEAKLRMCDLAAEVLLSPSGLSRRVERLERAGFVKRERASTDGRSIEATLTTSGKRLFRRLRETHLRGVKERFADRFSAKEIERLRDLLARLERQEPTVPAPPSPAESASSSSSSSA